MEGDLCVLGDGDEREWISMKQQRNAKINSQNEKRSRYGTRIETDTQKVPYRWATSDK